MQGNNFLILKLKWKITVDVSVVGDCLNMNWQYLEVALTSTHG